MIGTTLGNRYRLVRQLGIGGMARVFLAVDTRLGGNVAIKVLHPQFAEEKAYIERFAREAKMAGGLDSPHIVKILEYGQDREYHYLVIEYVDGQDIRKVIESEGPLAVEGVLDIADQVAEALQHAYERGIIHRDIKSP
ncbi:MAG: protein kinase, partial [Chloroflexota bacterium]